nr:reverse transcriptase domain-containing protein [Tanacetum cinerariifolium]
MIAKEGPHAGRKHCSKGKIVKKGFGTQDQKGRSLIIEKDDLSQPWVCNDTDAFTPRIWYFDFPKTQLPSHVKTYDGSEDPEDHLKIFQAAAKTKRRAMPTWCHMFNFTLTKNARMWWAKLEDAILLSASTFLFSPIGICLMENSLKVPVRALTFSRHRIMPGSFAILAINASYSASLLEASNLYLNAY